MPLMPWAGSFALFSSWGLEGKELPKSGAPGQGSGGTGTVLWLALCVLQGQELA